MMIHRLITALVICLLNEKVYKRRIAHHYLVAQPRYWLASQANDFGTSFAGYQKASGIVPRLETIVVIDIQSTCRDAGHHQDRTT